MRHERSARQRRRHAGLSSVRVSLRHLIFALAFASAGAFVPNLSNGQPPPTSAAARQARPKLNSSTEDGNKETTRSASTSTSSSDGKTLYEILRASPTATKSELKRHYVTLARATHPDALIGKSTDGLVNSAEESDLPDFNEVARAYKILSDPLERKRYDRSLQADKFVEETAQFAESVGEAVGDGVKEAWRGTIGAAINAKERKEKAKRMRAERAERQRRARVEQIMTQRSEMGERIKAERAQAKERADRIVAERTKAGAEARARAEKERAEREELLRRKAEPSRAEQAVRERRAGVENIMTQRMEMGERIKAERAQAKERADRAEAEKAKVEAEVRARAEKEQAEREEVLQRKAEPSRARVEKKEAEGGEAMQRAEAVKVEAERAEAETERVQISMRVEVAKLKEEEEGKIKETDDDCSLLKKPEEEEGWYESYRKELEAKNKDNLVDHAPSNYGL